MIKNNDTKNNTMKSRLIFTSLLALSLAACTDGNAPMTPADGEVAARIMADINNVATRASGDVWTADDRIGISTVPGTKTSYANIPYIWNGTEFGPESTVIYFQSQEEVTFNAYYPFAGTVGASAGIIAKTTDANAQKGLPAIDFLFAEGAKADKTNPMVEFTDKSKNNVEDNSFHHRMSMIAIKFTEGDDMAFAGGKLQSYTLKGLVLEGTFNTETGEAKTTDGEQAADLTISIENPTVDNGVFTAAPVILFPQDMNGAIGIEVTVDEQTYKATLVIPNGKKALEAGNNYTWPITVSKTGMSVGQAEIKDWITVQGDDVTATM
jgi:hypothetical protein